ncbi:MAG: NAD-glutamate dehydrogenase domain-containing protein, partial [Pseudomonadota bacterium]
VVPRDVVRFDGDDPYLVVAADKGTATFSDYANALSIAKGHWLGDAFASGGSAGYDHKKMGITARGAWECVKRHFRERDLDIQTTPFSVVGVGDMSGDVFGNGMLLSPAIQLVAAFDHRDIFIDPNPDPVSSLAERERLFALGRSSWQDYDTSKLSAGGGIFPRASKSIDLTPEIRERLGISERAVTPNALMRAILKAEADLMWFGGIGTYVRAPDQTDADVGDRANDAIRVTSDDLRVRAIGEGANLGATQEGRVAFAARGGRINTDFIDNSAGVNSSDIEVNIKIALGAAVASGKLDIEARNALLTRMTEEVAASCLRNNQQQALAISLVEREGATRLGYLSRLMTDLESRGLLDRDIEDLPDAAASAERAVAGRGLERPEIAVLLSHAKIALSAELMQGQLANDPALEPLLFAYFPSEMRRDYADEIRGHRLAKEIVVTAVTNSIANRAGPAAVIRLADETGRTTGEIAKALMVVRDVFDLPALWRDIEALGFDVSGSQQLALLGEIQATMVDAAAASLRSTDTGHLAELVATDRPVVERIAAALTTAYATDKQVAAHSEIVARLTAANVPEAIARAYADLGLVRYAPMVRRLSAQSGAPIERVAPVVFNAIDQFRLADLTDLSRSGGVTDYYDRLALSSAMAAIEKAASDAARIRLDGGPSAGTRIDRAAERLEDVVASGGVVSVSRLTVVASQIRDLMQG